MTNLCSYLGWDTDFFGRRIARVNPTRLSDDQADQALAWCEANRIDCLYFLAESDDAETVRAAEAHQFALVDVRITLEWRGTRSNDSGNLRLSRPDDIEPLKAMARVNHHDTRFYYDGHFSPERCDALYATWIERDYRENTVLVAERDGQAAGYITCALRDGVGQIGLLGVGAAWQGQGLGGLLVNGALGWFSQHGSEHVQVVTQGRNVRAQRVYQRSGFVTSQMQFWYHRWFERKGQP